MSSAHALASLLARFLLSAIFVIAGAEKLMGYEGTVGYMEQYGVPGALLPVVIFTELAGGLAILFGVLTRWAALGLAAFSLLAALIFHADLGDSVQFVLFLKNLAIAGGLLLLAVHGPGAYALRS